MARTDRPEWAVEGGLPSAHTIRAAIHAARLIDVPGSPSGIVDVAYVVYPSDGLFPPPDMRMGLALLVHCGLVVRQGDRLERTAAMSELLGMHEVDALAAILGRVATEAGADQPDDVITQVETLATALGVAAERREALLMALTRRHDDAIAAAIGAAGEELVVESAKEELAVLGLSQLVPGVRRVSLVTDALGYDVVAPSLRGMRRLEVKTSGREETGIFTFYISRPEYEWGVRDSDWALVACRMRDGVLRLIGWCRAEAITPYLPSDASAGRWESARVSLPEPSLMAGLPSAV